VQTTPLLADLRRVDPDARIDVLAWAEFASILEGLPGVTVRTIPSRRVLELNEEIERAHASRSRPQQAPVALKELGLPAYDWVINVSHGIFSAWLSGRLNARTRDGGVLNDNGEWLYSGDWLTFLVALMSIRRTSVFNIVDLYRGCAAAGPPAADAHAHAACSASLPFEWPEGRPAVVAPGANEEHRRFSIPSTVEVFSQLASMGFHVVLVGGPAEVPFAGALAAEARIPVTDLTGKTSVQQLAETLRRAEIVLAADSGPAHIAAVLGRPLVGLYGASLAPLTTAPWGEGHLVMVADRMEAFSSEMVMAAIRARLGMADAGDLRRETGAVGAQAWRTAMLPATADPLGGITYLPLHADRLEGRDTLSRLMRHVMAAVIVGSDTVDLSHLASLAPFAAPTDLGPHGFLNECESQIRSLAADVGGGLKQLRRRRFDGLSELAGHVTATIDELQHRAIDDPLIAPAILFLEWKLRVMPAYSPERIFEENERELKRAAKALRMARDAAARLWPLRR
jgi:ADP-heptose:LPS heptosyltransferase